MNFEVQLLAGAETEPRAADTLVLFRSDELSYAYAGLLHLVTAACGFGLVGLTKVQSGRDVALQGWVLSSQDQARAIVVLKSLVLGQGVVSDLSRLSVAWLVHSSCFTFSGFAAGCPPHLYSLLVPRFSTPSLAKELLRQDQRAVQFHLAQTNSF